MVRELLKDGHQVRAFVRKTSKLDGLEGLDVEYAYGDVRDADSLRVAAEGCELMYQTAAAATMPTASTSTVTAASC